ncbi:anti-sigma factor antagonist [Saccharothrix longispora]|uniref:Anti-sigma factor antagonist n=1 Tax=Saccharothrix longispora TaxID=33920 RepID=A0ABU1PRW1_9PSEU|nr:anti-sigma factor antagonist [Saccharothrix longispora]MDR6593377.1 anti-anti-sigma factor [Saccharothrix longispora]
MTIAERFDDQLRVEREVHGYAVVVRVTGEVDASTTPAIRREVRIALALATPPAPVVIDLRGVGFFAAAGLNELYWDLSAAESVGVALRVVASQRHVLRPFGICGLDAELRPYPTLDAALRAGRPDRSRVKELTGLC